MKRFLMPFLFLILCVFALQAGSQPEKTFSWNLGLQNVKSGEMIPFSAPVKSWTGEQFRLVIESGTNCFCYVIAESPNGDEVAALYSGALKAKDVWYSPVLELSLPKGAESLFVIASQEEQKTLAQRIAALNSSAPAQRALMSEIFRLRGEVSQFKEAPEKPVLMGGASRGTPEKSQGVEFSGSGIYVKTISIEH